MVNEKLNLHKIFVAEEAIAHVVFVWKRHYNLVLINELGLNIVSDVTSKFMKVLKPVDRVLSGNIFFLKNWFNLEVIKMN